MIEIQILVPVESNEKVPFTAEEFRALDTLICDRFGGCTVFPQPVQGMWRDEETGEVFADTLRVYAVWTDRAEVSDDVRAVVDYIKVAFAQRAVSVRFPSTGEALIL